MVTGTEMVAEYLLLQSKKELKRKYEEEKKINRMKQAFHEVLKNNYSGYFTGVAEWSSQ